MENLKILFGRKIKELRKKYKYTQAQLAELVNVDDKHISCIESGKNFPSPDLLERIAKSLQIEIKDLFEFNYLKNSSNLKQEISKMLENLDENQLQLAYKFIKTFLI